MELVTKGPFCREYKIPQRRIKHENKIRMLQHPKFQQLKGVKPRSRGTSTSDSSQMQTNNS